MGIKVYKFWCIPASAEDDQRMRVQLQLAAVYRRELVRIENELREQLRGIAPPKEASPEDKKAYYQSETFKTQQAAFREERARKERAERTKAVTAGLYWGTYLLVERAVEQAARTTPLWDEHGPRNVKPFSPYDEGRIAVQIQSTRPLIASALIGGNDTRVKISAEKYSLTGWVGGYRARSEGPSYNKAGCLRPARLRELAIRVGSMAGKREPIWAHFHILMHRDLPLASLSWATVVRRRFGCVYRYEAQFTVDEEDRVVLTGRAAACGIDIGWRKLPDGSFRVAYLVGSDGHRDELIVPADVHARQPKSESLRSIRDRERDRVRDQLALFLRTVRDAGGELPAWATEALPHLHQWQRIGRFVKLLRAWRAERIVGDQGMFTVVEAWLKHDRHLFDWEAHNLRRMRLQVRGRIESWCVAVCKRYDTVVIEDLDLASMRQRPADGDDDYQRALAAKRGQALAPGEVRQHLRWLSKKYVTQLLEVNAAHTTKECAHCQQLRDGDIDWSQLVIACPHCGVSEDQDVTAAKNLLASGLLAKSAHVNAPDEMIATTKRKLPPRRIRKRVKIEPLAS